MGTNTLCCPLTSTQTSLSTTRQVLISKVDVLGELYSSLPEQKFLKSSHISTKFAVVTNCCNLTLRTFTGKAQIKTKAPAVVVADTADVTLFNATSSDSWKISSSNQPIRPFAFNPDSRTSSGIMQRSATAPKRTLSSCLNKEVDRQSSSQTSVNANYITQNSSGVDHKRLKILHKSGTGSSYSFDAKASAVSGRKQ